MRIYQIKGDLREYKTLELNGFDIASKLGRMDELAELNNFTSTNTSLTDIWQQIATSFYAESSTANHLPDIMVWAGSALVMSEETYQKLKQYISNDGELLPISVDGALYFIFNCLQYAKEDSNQTISEYVDGEVVGLKNLVFDEITESQTLFKSKKQGGSILYCTSNFKGLCEEFKLEGLIFDEDLLSPFS